MRYINLHLTFDIFSGSGYRMMSVKFYNDRPWMPWQPHLRQNRLQLRSYRKYRGAACA